MLLATSRGFYLVGANLVVAWSAFTLCFIKNLVNKSADIKNCLYVLMAVEDVFVTRNIFMKSSDS